MTFYFNDKNNHTYLFSALGRGQEIYSQIMADNDNDETKAMFSLLAQGWAKTESFYVVSSTMLDGWVQRTHKIFSFVEALDFIRETMTNVLSEDDTRSYTIVPSTIKLTNGVSRSNYGFVADRQFKPSFVIIQNKIYIPQEV